MSVHAYRQQQWINSSTTSFIVLPRHRLLATCASWPLAACEGKIIRLLEGRLFYIMIRQQQRSSQMPLGCYHSVSTNTRMERAANEQDSRNALSAEQHSSNIMNSKWETELSCSMNVLEQLQGNWKAANMWTLLTIKSSEHIFPTILLLGDVAKTFQRHTKQDVNSVQSSIAWIIIVEHSGPANCLFTRYCNHPEIFL